MVNSYFIYILCMIFFTCETNSSHMMHIYEMCTAREVYSFSDATWTICVPPFREKQSKMTTILIHNSLSYFDWPVKLNSRSRIPIHSASLIDMSSISKYRKSRVFSFLTSKSGMITLQSMMEGGLNSHILLDTSQS